MAEEGIPPVPDVETNGWGAWNTPIALNENNSQTFSFQHKDYLSRYPRLAKEATPCTIGPMPVKDFLRAFLPCPAAPDNMPSPDGAFVEIEKAKKEPDIYLPLISALNLDSDPERSRCPGFTFRKTCNHADKKGGTGGSSTIGSTKPDILCYANQHLGEAESGAGDPTDETDMGFAATFIKVKATAADDYFSDPGTPRGVPRDSWCFVLRKHQEADTTGRDRRLRDFGQSIAYAVAICQRQHRLFCFSVIIAGHMARLIRWDRAGAIVTESFDVLAEPALLCELFWRFAHVSDSGRGYDFTVGLASRVQERRFRKAVKPHVVKQMGAAGVEAGLDIQYMRRFVSSVRLRGGTDTDATTDRILLVSRPLAFPLSIICCPQTPTVQLRPTTLCSDALRTFSSSVASLPSGGH
ncbi:hypothetical protein BV20DRAFT_618224 [Pilatotrama ljubarskyi]|nr:hypothetical protein BV20DRAFT_618224 [Pilatotrama ljubarskyi]